MPRRAAVIGTLLFVLLGTGLEGVVAPALLSEGWRVGADWPAGARAAGAVLIVLGAAGALDTLARLALDGRGTPSPVAPTRQLVVRGAYRIVRHPMYVATAALIAGQGLLLGRPVLLLGAGLYLATMVALVRLREEPALRARHGSAYADYAARVPGWLPRGRLRR